MRSGAKLLLVGLAVVVGGVLIGLYVSKLTKQNASAAYTWPVKNGANGPEVNITIQTVAAVGPKLSPNPEWVSYLIQKPSGEWARETVWKLPANATVHVTIYNFDGASALRNNYLARPQGVDNNQIVVDGKTLDVLPPDDASHTFAVPQLGLIVPVAPVTDDMKNQCDYAPCSMSNAHRTETFTFHTKGPGHYRWQCFVPCAAGWIDGFGGPMQTIGYMDGFLDVS
ncbi:MAG TPA: hypothetical protein VFJ91_01260 [Gaiellaceae bacterium]|nr:hypothetical protein [Gaiellaceae bacterium]